MTKSLGLGSLQRNWGWLLALGILFVILGCIGLGMTVGITLVSMYFFGFLLIIAGVFQFIDSFQDKEWKGTFWHILIAALYIIAGLVVLYDPFLASTLITAMIAGILIVIGVARMTMGFTLKNTEGWGWLIAGGLISILLGVLILLQWPISGLWVIGLFITIELIFSGWTYIFIALALKNKK